MEIDKAKILNKINIIETSLNKLRQLSALSLNEFKNDFKNYDSAKYNLQISIEAMIDIGNHIISRKSLGVPKTYADTFEILCENGILPKDMLNIYKAMTKFRNKIVHFYDKVDDAEVYNIINNNLQDIENFIKNIKDVIDAV